MIPVRPFYMLRHGQSEANVANVIAGRGVDSPLTAQGRAEAETVRSTLSQLDIPPQVIVHSSLSRARDTAYIVNKFLGLPTREDPNLCEFDAGDLEGSPYPVFRDLVSRGEDPPGGETHIAFRERIRNALDLAISQNPSPVLVVSHGGVFRAFGEIYQFPLRGISNCTLYEFEPLKDSHRIPWRIWCYDANGNKAEHILQAQAL